MAQAIDGLDRDRAGAMGIGDKAVARRQMLNQFLAPRRLTGLSTADLQHRLVHRAHGESRGRTR